MIQKLILYFSNINNDVCSHLPDFEPNTIFCERSLG